MSLNDFTLIFVLFLSLSSHSFLSSILPSSQSFHPRRSHLLVVFSPLRAHFVFHLRFIGLICWDTACQYFSPFYLIGLNKGERLNRDLEADNCFPVARGDTTRPSNSSREHSLSFSSCEFYRNIIWNNWWKGYTASTLEIIDDSIRKKILMHEFIPSFFNRPIYLFPRLLIQWFYY